MHPPCSLYLPMLDRRSVSLCAVILGLSGSLIPLSSNAYTTQLRGITPRREHNPFPMVMSFLCLFQMPLSVCVADTSGTRNCRGRTSARWRATTLHHSPGERERERENFGSRCLHHPRHLRHPRALKWGSCCSNLAPSSCAVDGGGRSAPSS